MDFIKEYENRRYEAELYPEVVDLLPELKAAGIRHSILSAQHQNLLDDLVQFYNIRHHFMRIIGLNNHYAHSKVENGIEWVNKINLSLHEIIMIGDTIHDFEVAGAIGIDWLLLSHGHHCLERLNKTGTKVVQNLNAILNFINI